MKKWVLISVLVLLSVGSVLWLRGIDTQAQSLNIVSPDGLSYATDGHYTYLNKKIIAGADPETFSSLSGGYAVDTNNVYYDGISVQGADPASFTVVSGTIDDKEYDAKDMENYYSAGDVVQ